MGSELTSITEDQFNQLYQYILKFSGPDMSSFEYGVYQLKIIDPDKISFCRGAYTLAFIHRKKGITVLAQKHNDNEKIGLKFHELITKLLNEAESHHESL